MESFLSYLHPMEQTETIDTPESNTNVSTEMVDSILDRLVVDPEIHYLRGPNELSPMRLVFRIPHINPSNIPLGRSSMVSVALESDDPLVRPMQSFVIRPPNGQQFILHFTVGQSWWAQKEFCRLLWSEAVNHGWTVSV
jgi:hypothetical protein